LSSPVAPRNWPVGGADTGADVVAALEVVDDVGVREGLDEGDWVVVTVVV
jgi:hypothetical protein